MLSAGLAGALLLSAATVSAATLQQVNGWSMGGVPSDVTMHVYVPDEVADKPPILALVHYCGGTAAAVFGQAQGGGLVKAANDYGFIMVVPSSGRCWDIVSDKTRKRDGGGDSDAIMQMVKHALATYQGNADRVYATGDSSGGMMTELLLALYPDVFKAGSAFAGMPAGCRGPNESGSGGGYSNACAGGSVSHTPEEWGNIARGLFPGYTGPRPRVQLFHGDADDIIRYPNHTEAIKEWTNVLGVGPNATTTDNSVPLGDHQAKRERWENACGQVVVDAFTSLGGDHGPSDALFAAQYVVPFLGLDKTGPLDPVPPCGAGGGGAGGAGGGGGGGDAATGGNAGAGGNGGVAGAGGPAGGGSGGSPSGGSGFAGASTGGLPSAPSAGAASGGNVSGSSSGPSSETGQAAGSSGAGTDAGSCSVGSYRATRPSSAGAWLAAGLLSTLLARARRRRPAARRGSR